MMSCRCDAAASTPCSSSPNSWRDGCAPSNAVGGGRRGNSRRLADRDSIVRWATARSLGRIDGKPVPGEIEALAGVLSDRDLSVRVAAASTLEGFGQRAAAAIPALLQAVNVGDADGRIGVLRALGAIGKEGKQVVPVVARALAHPDARVRRAAAETIGHFGADATLAANALERALRDVDPEVRRFASE